MLLVLLVIAMCVDSVDRYLSVVGESHVCLLHSLGIEARFPDG